MRGRKGTKWSTGPVWKVQYQQKECKLVNRTDVPIGKKRYILLCKYFFIVSGDIKIDKRLQI